MALIIAVLIAVKILVVLIKPKAWMGVVEFFYSKPIISMVVSLVLAAVVLNYLLEAVHLPLDLGGDKFGDG